MKRIITAVLSLLMVTSCNAQNNNVETLSATSMKNDKSQKQNNMNKSIVIFFSHAGDNYSVGNIEVGNTKIVADYITEIKGADQTNLRSSHTSTTAWPICRLSNWPRKKPTRANCRHTKAPPPTSANTTPSSSVVPCGGAPIRR